MQLDRDQRKAAQAAVESGLLAVVLDELEQRTFLAWADARDSEQKINAEDTVSALRRAFEQQQAAQAVADLIRMGAGNE